MVDTIILKKGPSVRYTTLKSNNKLQGKGPDHDKNTYYQSHSMVQPDRGDGPQQHQRGQFGKAKVYYKQQV